MCGIAGIISSQPIDLLLAKKINDKLIHRGPDGYGYLCSDKTINVNKIDKVTQLTTDLHTQFVFAHRRLAINDLTETGHQPMAYQNKYWLVFNGEIYNFIELRKELENNNYTFNSQTDSEIILAAYDFWGVECFKKFNGDWALVLLDTVENTIIISRDRFGIKPLYYYSAPDLFIFASEIKAILEHPTVTREPNLSYLQNYLRNGPQEYIKETAFKEISRFSFASYFKGSLSDIIQPNKMILKKYWTLNPNLSNEALNQNKLTDYIQHYYSLLKDAVKIRLRGDVKIGANLSGGLDSSTVVYLMNELNQTVSQHNSLETFSSVYKSNGTSYCDESKNINEMVRFLNANSNQIEPNVDEVPNEHRKMIYHLDNPPESTLMSSWYTAKLINSANIKIAISGEGADEQLAGYYRYITYHLATMSIHKTISYFRFFNLAGASNYIQVGLIANLFKTFLGKKVTQFLFGKVRKEKIFTPVNEKLKEDIMSNLVNLHHIDEHVFMAFSIEHRSPFMDYRLVEFLASIPISYKLAKGKTKYLARKTFERLLPNNIIWSKKKLGWPIPEQFWFEGKLENWMKKTIANSPLLKQNFADNIKNLNQKSITKKIRLLNIAVWHDLFFNTNN